MLTDGERIAAIFPSGSRPVPAGATVYDLAGRYLIPGLIDTHVHVATDPSGEDTRARTERRLRGALRGGVTAVRDMAGDTRALASLQRDALLGEIASPDIYYAALFAGPAFFADPRTHNASRGVIPGQAPWMRAVTDTTNLRRAVAEARGTGATAIKLYAELSGALARRITAEAHSQGLLVWAHAALDQARPIEVVEAGVDAISHANLAAQAMDSARRAAVLHAPASQALDLHEAGLDSLFAAMARRHTIFEPTLLIFADRAPALRLAGAIARAAQRAGCDDHRRHRHPGFGRRQFTHVAQSAPGAGAVGDPGGPEPGGSARGRDPRCVCGPRRSARPRHDRGGQAGRSGGPALRSAARYPQHPLDSARHEAGAGGPPRRR